MFVQSLHIYPVKSLRGHEVQRTAVAREGLAGDRRWLVTDTQGKLLTQREIPKMAQVSVKVTSTGIELSHEQHGKQAVATPTAAADIAIVTVWRHTGPARRADAAGEAWLSEVLGQKVWLTHMHDVNSRPVNPAFGKPEDRVSFADGYPILLVNSASLVDLSRRGCTSDMRQFRPNIVIDTNEPWVEDTWRRLRIGSLTFRIAKLCERCVMTTLDPTTGQQKPQDLWPLTHLGKFHRDVDGKIMFGQNAIPDAPGEIAVGDKVELLETGPTAIVQRVKPDLP